MSRGGKSTHGSTLRPCPPLVGLLGIPRCIRWVRLEILVRRPPRRGPRSSGIGTSWLTQMVALSCRTRLLVLPHARRTRAALYLHAPRVFFGGQRMRSRPVAQC
eukprot:8699324-Pyramimonas_sp.AAC.1